MKIKPFPGTDYSQCRSLQLRISMMDSKNNKQEQQQQNSVSGELEETGHDSHEDLENQGQEF